MDFPVILAADARPSQLFSARIGEANAVRAGVWCVCATCVSTYPHEHAANMNHFDMRVNLVLQARRVEDYWLCTASASRGP